MKRILLVEDEQALARHLTRLLQAEGFTVVHAATQRAAVACLEETPLDLALVDISLPDGNGFAVCTAIKQAQAIPVLFLTASADEDSVVTGLCLGGDDYITKPFRPQELLARITAALRKSGRAPSVFSLHGLTVDTASGMVQKQGQEVFLSPLEYRLLLIFLNNPNMILTRDRLLDELWDAAGEFVNNNTLTVYIKRLREKIEPEPSAPQIILTVRGTGYRLGGGPWFEIRNCGSWPSPVLSSPRSPPSEALPSTRRPVSCLWSLPLLWAACFWGLPGPATAGLPSWRRR